MKKLLKKSTACMVLLSILFGTCGCTPTHSNELVKEVNDRIVPMAITWMEEHVENAENIDCAAEENNTNTLFSDVVTGTYEKEGTTYNFALNVDTEEYASSEYYNTYVSCVEEYMAALLPEKLKEGLKYNSVLVYPETDTVKGHIVSDQNSSGNKTDRSYGEGEAYASYIVHEYSEEELRERAAYAVDSEELIVRLYMDEEQLENVEVLFADLTFIREHPNWEIHFYTMEKESVYVNANWDGEFVLIRYYKDSSGKTQSEYIAREK